MLNQLVAITLLLSSGLGSLAVPHFARQTTTTSQILHAGSSTGKCIDVRGGVLKNGTPVQLYDCNGSSAQKWLIQRGSTKVQLSGTNFCLDAGSDPANGVGMKIWQCYDGLAAQQWYYTDDNRIALKNQGFCLDLTNGDTSNSNQLQTWHCTANNKNQVWLSSNAPPTSTPSGAHPLHPTADKTKCLDVQGAKFANGTPVQIYDCNGTGAQNWVIHPSSTKVQVAGTNFCLDAGANPSAGTGMKIWQCYNNLPAQQWFFSDKHIKLVSANLCLDLTNGNTANGNKVQVWNCIDGNTNQMWVE